MLATCLLFLAFQSVSDVRQPNGPDTALVTYSERMLLGTWEAIRDGSPRGRVRTTLSFHQGGKATISELYLDGNGGAILTLRYRLEGDRLIFRSSANPRISLGRRTMHWTQREEGTGTVIRTQFIRK